MHRLAILLVLLGPASPAWAADWPGTSFDSAETRFSPLTAIDSGNVTDLGLAWSYDLGSTRGVEATPLVVDGVMYVTAPWSIVHAIDARTGRRLWIYDPQVPRGLGSRGCCDVVNRGVAWRGGRVFVASFDGRLIALDAKSGRRVWEQDTIIDHTRPYTITGAPRIVRDKVVIGNAGAELGVRGYVTAYDAGTGAQRWRWFTVPGDPAKPFEDASMARAAKTWDPAGKWWIAGGGGTVWDSMAYDPALNLLYVGTGNGSPWSRDLRSPAGGDNLYLASIVALNPDTGEYVWHYQATPGDNWDYTSTQSIVLADLTIAGKPRKVLLHAPKNGFFFVIDRVTGQFISAMNFVDVNWARGYDAQGRPIERAEARSRDRPYDAIPGPYGAHNWQPMSFNPQTGLAYIPAQNLPTTMALDPSWSYNAKRPGQVASGLGWNLAAFVNPVPPTSLPFGRLIAWDPLRQKEAWRYEHKVPWNGGTLTTAGNLVFQGTADGRFLAFDATTGKLLWEAPTGNGVIAAPATYGIDGRQYVSIAVGWGGSRGLTARATDFETAGRILTFAPGSRAPLPESTAYRQGALLSGVPYDPGRVQAGLLLYVSHCAICHGTPAMDRGGAIHNLGYSDAALIRNLDQIVFNGPFVSLGMPDFTGKLTPDDVGKIKAFIQATVDSVRAMPPPHGRP